MSLSPQTLNIADFDYELPSSRIANYPAQKRSASKLLISKNRKAICQDYFYNLHNYLPDSGLLIFNNTRVVQARLKFRKESGAGIEIFCLQPVSPVSIVEQSFKHFSPVIWKCFIGNARKWKSGLLSLDLDWGKLYAEKLGIDGNAWQVRFSWTPASLSWGEILEKAGQVPLPPYINRESEPTDKKRYQTVFASKEGSVAAPTAGLHFTPAVFDNLKTKNIRQTYLTLHVGAGTFKPVVSESLQDHSMHREQMVISRETLEELLNTPLEKTIAVGTTAVRTLESLYCYATLLKDQPDAAFHIEQWQAYKMKHPMPREEALSLLLEKMKRENRTVFHGTTQLLIAPGYQYQMTGGMLTNFHQPKSTLLLLLAAFTGEHWKKAYTYALENDFRFLSYGDSCLFLP
ncbi:MAG: S-adenosylmethionine:tRNA ribosyltransferase-isomerase [Bacteroidales bacterium]